MTRQARVKSPYGYYHVMMRGCGKQYLFEEDYQRRFFMSVAGEACTQYKASLCAWCLMDNHVHMLLSDHEDHMWEIIHYIGTLYGQFFNRVTGRCGPVFQDRYKSKPIESNDYFMQAIRYIHDNPIELGCRPECYQWSSYQAYLGEGGHLDRSILFSLIGGQGNFESFSKSGRKDTYVLNTGRSMTVFEQERKARGVLNGMDPHDVIGLPGPFDRAEAVRRLYEAGFSERQIVRLTGLGRYVVQTAVKSL